MFSFEMNCTAWRRGGLGELGWDPASIWFYDPIKTRG